MLARTTFLLLTGVLASLVSSGLLADVHILLSTHATPVEHHAAEELKADIVKVYRDEAVLVRTFQTNTKLETRNHYILLGRQDSHNFFTGLDGPVTFPLSGETLGPETFVLQSGASAKNLFAIMGADDRGVLYGVYEFSSRVLGIDAMEYWTGNTPSPRKDFKFPEIAYREQTPVFKLRGYFDNDNDHLANWQGRKLIVEFETWKEMIDSLARLRYNYIDIHDLLGRPEYYLRDYYTQMTGFHTDLELVEQVIDYAHTKGLLVQIPMYLGWEFKHLSMDEICLTENFDRWMEIYEYYLSETPLGKGDLFLARPRHPIYDWAYNCPAEKERGIEPGPLLESVFEGLGSLIQKYRPGGQLFCDLWQEGRPLWANGDFAPGKDVQMLWADNGFADFGGLPGDLMGYDFGVYIHAGVWHNQVVQDPYPGRIKNALQTAADKGMNHNALVNGQGFKPFILNLEASARAMWDPRGFDDKAFIIEWTSRYFGADASRLTVDSLTLLHEAQADIKGYRDVTKQSQKILRNLAQGKTGKIDLNPIHQALGRSGKAVLLARQAETKIPAISLEVFDDQLLFPVTIYLQNLELLLALAEFNNATLSIKQLAEGTMTTGDDSLAMLAMNARGKLLTLRASLETGSRWKKWKNWYLPENFRIHTPPPSLEGINSVFERILAQDL